MNSAIYFLRRQIFYLSLHTNIKPKNMNSIHDIADYIILRVKSEDKNASLINLKLQKLLYYVQAWSYGINKKSMFTGDFEAWIHGPVNRESTFILK